jgi:hypothetical protein
MFLPPPFLLPASNTLAHFLSCEREVQAPAVASGAALVVAAVLGDVVGGVVDWAGGATRGPTGQAVGRLRAKQNLFKFFFYDFS